MTMFLINGQETTSLSVHDRALHYGDGLFETIAIKNGLPLALNRHLKRLNSSCKRLGITCPDEGLLEKESLQVSEGLEKGVLKLIISRGPGGRGYQSPEHQETTRIAAKYNWPDYPDQLSKGGVVARICKQRLGHQPSLAGMKHLNRLEQVLLRDEVKRHGDHEGLVLDIRNNVIEGSMSNLFFIKGKNIFTPDLSLCGVAGIIRDAILEMATRLGMSKSITDISLETLLQADEVFFCNSIIGIWPVRHIEEQLFSVGPYSQEIRKNLIKAKLIAG